MKVGTFEILTNTESRLKKRLKVDSSNGLGMTRLDKVLLRMPRFDKDRGQGYR